MTIQQICEITGNKENYISEQVKRDLCILDRYVEIIQGRMTDDEFKEFVEVLCCDWELEFATLAYARIADAK